MNSLQTEIKRRIDESGTTISALERDANLKKGSLYNIVAGRSKNPGIAILQPVAKQLGCSVLELYGAEETVQSPKNEAIIAVPAGEIKDASEKDTKAPAIIKWDAKLYAESLKLVRDNCEQRNFTSDKATMLGFIEEIYDYSLNNGTGFIDVKYGEWILRRNLFKEV